MRFGSTPVRLTSSQITCAPRSSGRTSFSAPPCFPIGVRIASMITASGIKRPLAAQSLPDEAYKSSACLRHKVRAQRGVVQARGQIRDERARGRLRLRLLGLAALCAIEFGQALLNAPFEDTRAESPRAHERRLQLGFGLGISSQRDERLAA